MGGTRCVLISVLVPTYQLINVILIPDSHKYSETLENVTQLNRTVMFLFHQTVKAAVQFDSEKTVQVFMNDLTKEPDFLKYSDDTVCCSGQLVCLRESSSCRF